MGGKKSNIVCDQALHAGGGHNYGTPSRGSCHHHGYLSTSIKHMPYQWHNPSNPLHNQRKTRDGHTVEGPSQWTANYVQLLWESVIERVKHRRGGYINSCTLAPTYSRRSYRSILGCEPSWLHIYLDSHLWAIQACVGGHREVRKLGRETEPTESLHRS